jgi:hypothetical protein
MLTVLFYLCFLVFLQMVAISVGLFKSQKKVVIYTDPRSTPASLRKSTASILAGGNKTVSKDAHSTLLPVLSGVSPNGGNFRGAVQKVKKRW